MSDPVYKRFGGINSPVHGGTEHAPGVLDFSISVSPFELPQSVKNAYHESILSIGNYPDTRNRLLKKSIVDAFEVDFGKLLITNGSAEAFNIIAGVLLKQGSAAYILSPCYSDYEHVSRLSGAEVIVHRLESSCGFKPDPEVIIGEIRSSKPGLVWLCSPNNPTGVILEPEFIDKIARTISEYGGFVVIDEAYSAFSLRGPTSFMKILNHKNIVFVRSMTKDFGIPGLRLGFIYAEAELIHILDLHKPCWSVSTPAQAVGSAVFTEAEYYTACWRKLGELRSNLLEGMSACGIEPFMSSANECGIFIFFKSPERPGEEPFIMKMAANGIIIRDCESMGAPGFCRTGVKLSEDNEKFLAAIRKVLDD